MLPEVTVMQVEIKVMVGTERGSVGSGWKYKATHVCLVNLQQIISASLQWTLSRAPPPQDLMS